MTDLEIAAQALSQLIYSKYGYDHVTLGIGEHKNPKKSYLALDWIIPMPAHVIDQFGGYKIKNKFVGPCYALGA